MSEFIPKRVLPTHLVQESRSQKANDDYQAEIQAIVAKLVDEYKIAISGQDSNPSLSEDSLLESINSSSAAEEQQVRYPFL